ncbi:MAG TPA: N-acetyltransferase [Caldithrix sp.]|nr:N-acetyltransferase [Caldithrix sp.]
MAVNIVPVINSKQKKQFINFEWTVNKSTPNWISPLRTERIKVLNTKKNPFYSHAEIQLFLAYNNDKITGRIAAITNQNYNNFQNDNAGFFGFFDCINDQEAANALFRAAADWLKQKGKDLMYGPMNPSTNDEVGILIDGFDTPPYMMMTHNATYYPQLAEGFGLTKAKDLYAWFVTSDDALKNVSDKMRRVSEKILKKYNITIRNLVIKNLKEEIKLIKDIYNNAWSRNWGFVPFTDDEINVLAKDLALIADEDLLLLAEKEGNPIAFSLTLPNINEVLQRIPTGRLYPTGIFKLLTGMKKIKYLRVLVLGVKKEFQFLGLGSIFYIETIMRAKEKGYLGGEMSWILEDNYTMNKPIEDVGAKKYKTYRVYQYPL